MVWTGVYFALEGNVSLGSYAVPSTTLWKHAEYPLNRCAAICEVLNNPKQ